VKRLLTVFFALVIIGAAAARDKLAILPFSGGDEGEGEIVAELLSSEWALTNFFDFVPRTSINQAIREEQNFRLASETEDPGAAAALGRQLGARYVACGSITALDRQKLLVISVFKVDDLRQITGDFHVYRGIEDIRRKLPATAWAIVDGVRLDVSGLSRLAVTPVILNGGADPLYAALLTRLLTVHLVRSEAYAVYPGTSSFEELRREYLNQRNRNTAGGNAVSPAPELALSAAARKEDYDTLFNAAVIKLESGLQTAGGSAGYRTMEEGIGAMQELFQLLALRNRSADSAEALASIVAAINADVAGGEYTITINGDFTAAEASFEHSNAVKTITVRGDSAPRTIRGGRLFSIRENNILVLGNNLTLDGNGYDLVYLWGGGFVMEAGATIRGGSVDINSGAAFTMNGGAISGNTANGVNVSQSVFTMNGGAISGNTINGGDSGGGENVQHGRLTMSGGIISGNIANGGGGGVCVMVSSFTMSGGTISGNTTNGNGGGVFVGGDFNTFTMSGGIIRGNTSNGGGGGVYVESGRFIKRGGTIGASNRAGGGGNSVYVRIDDTTSRQRNAAAGAGVNMDSSIEGSAGGWE
jgi:hypothetical protein